MDPATPACIIENGTLGDQRQVIAHARPALRARDSQARRSIVIGDVVRLARARRSEHKAKAA